MILLLRETRRKSVNPNEKRAYQGRDSIVKTYPETTRNEKSREYQSEKVFWKEVKDALVTYRFSHLSNDSVKIGGVEAPFRRLM